MRKTLPVLLLTLLLPGCMLAIGDTKSGHDEDDRVERIEQRVAALEECMANCELAAKDAKVATTVEVKKEVK